MSNFTRLLDEIAAYATAAGYSFQGDELIKAEPPAPKQPKQPKRDMSRLMKSIDDAGAGCRKLNAANAKKKAKAAADLKAREDAVIAKRNHDRAAVSNVLAKALELNRLGKITVSEVARIEISANETLRRIG